LWEGTSDDCEPEANMPPGLHPLDDEFPWVEEVPVPLAGLEAPGVDHDVQVPTQDVDQTATIALSLADQAGQSQPGTSDINVAIGLWLEAAQ
jgi:hypothetical protein